MTCEREFPIAKNHPAAAAIFLNHLRHSLPEGWVFYELFIKRYVVPQHWLHDAIKGFCQLHVGRVGSIGAGVLVGRIGTYSGGNFFVDLAENSVAVSKLCTELFVERFEDFA